MEPKAGCAEILGRRSSGTSPEAPVEVTDGETAKDGLSEDGKIVGRRGASDVNVLHLD